MCSSDLVVAVRLDASGKPAWSSPKTLGSGSCRPRLQPIVRLKKGDLAYAATRWDGKKWRCELARFQPDGKLLWLKGHAAGAWCQSFAMTLTADDKIAVGSGTVAVGGKSFDVRISLHDGLGNLLAEHTVESAGSRFAKALHPLPGGAFRVAALEHVPDTSLYVPRLLVISAAGIQLEDVEVKSGLALLGGELVALADGGFLYAGGSQESKASQAARVARVAPGGTVRWIAPLFPSTYARDVALLDDGTIATMGNEWGKTLTGQLRLAVLDLWGHSKCSEDGGCMSKTVKDCDDGKLCTNVTCKTGKGCDNPELTGPCSDGLACSAPGQCVGGQCKGVGSALYDMATSPYPGPLGHYTSVNPSPDGGVVVCGHIDGGPGKAYTGLIEAYGPTGKNSWSKLYTDVKHRYSFWDVTRLANGGTVAVGQDGFGSGGTAQYNALLVYFDADGKELSQDIYQNKGHSMAYQAVTTVGGDELVVVATALKTGTSDSWTAIHQRLKPMGGIVWSFNDQHQRLLDVAPHPAGGFAAAGIYRKADGQKPALSMALARRFGEDGKSLWGNAFSDDGGGSRTLHALDVTPDGDLIGAGRQWTGKSSRMLLVAISAAGKELWFKTLGNASPGGATGIVKASDGYLLLGMDDKALDGKPGALMIRTDLAGAAIWQKAYGVGSADKVYRMAPMPGGGVAFVGGTKLGDVRPWIVRTDAWGHNACSKAGKCAAPSTPLCDDANPCTWDGCDTKKGCTHGPATEGLTCADGKTCTKGVCSKP